MSFLPPEVQAELRRQGILEEIAAIHLEEEAMKGKTFPEKVLAALGEWMVERGERLRKQHSAKQMNYSELDKKGA